MCKGKALPAWKGDHCEKRVANPLDNVEIVMFFKKAGESSMWFSVQAIFVSRGHVEMPGDILVVTTGEGGATGI